jgi:hypothetical protein
LRDDQSRDARMRAMVFEFDRTASRLIEMQSQEYLSQARRDMGPAELDEKELSS